VEAFARPRPTWGLDARPLVVGHPGGPRALLFSTADLPRRTSETKSPYCRGLCLGVWPCRGLR
jgi:hypothetical protein